MILGARRALDVTYGADPTGVADCAAAFEAAAAEGGIVIVPKGTYRLASVVDIANPVTFVFEGSPQINVVHDGAGFNITSSGVHFLGLGGRPVLNGPRATTEYASTSYCFVATGTAASRVSDVSFVNLEIKNFKHAGFLLTYCAKADVLENYIHNCTRAGALFLSCTDSKFNYNWVEDISPGFGGVSPYLNAYGVTFTASSASEAQCLKWQCNFNTITNVTSWAGIDTHGGQNGEIFGNSIAGCYLGIDVTTNGTQVPNYVRIIGNHIQSHPNSGAAINGGTVYPNAAILAAGIEAGQRARGIIIEGNSCYLGGYHDGTNFRPVISLQSLEGSICANNVLSSVSACAIAAFYTNFGLDIHSNLIQDLNQSAAETPRAIWVSSTTNVMSLRGNKLMMGSAVGTRYLYEIATQTAGWYVYASRDSFAHNATKWAPGSSAAASDLGTGL